MIWRIRDVGCMLSCYTKRSIRIQRATHAVLSCVQHHYTHDLFPPACFLAHCVMFASYRSQANITQWVGWVSEWVSEGGREAGSMTRELTGTALCH